jgi:peptidyl-dipeptidase Dcp
MLTFSEGLLKQTKSRSELESAVGDFTIIKIFRFLPKGCFSTWQPSLFLHIFARNNSKSENVKQLIFAIGLGVLMLGACQNNTSMTKQTDLNPFLEAYDTPFGVPPFDRIDNAHFLPAFKAGIKEQEAEIEAIVNNSETPTFENTIEAFDLSGATLRKVGGVFYRLLSAETSDELDSIAKVLVPLTSAHRSNTMLNEGLFQRVKTVYDQQDQLALNGEQSRVLDKIYKQFERGGANLDEAGKARIREIDEKLGLLTLQFGNNLLSETNAYQLVIEDEKDLAGLPASVRSAAAEAASKNDLDGKWLFTLHKPSWIPFLTYAEKQGAAGRDIQSHVHARQPGQ